MFFDNFAQLCKQKGVAPTRVALDIGINKSNVTTWRKKGFTPNAETLQKLAEYFNVSVDYLLTGEKKEPAQSAIQSYSEHEQLVIEKYRAKPDMQNAVDKLLGI